MCTGRFARPILLMVVLGVCANHGAASLASGVEDCLPHVLNEVTCDSISTVCQSVTPPSFRVGAHDWPSMVIAGIMCYELREVSEATTQRRMLSM